MLSFSFHHIFKEYLFLRRDEVPTPKHYCSHCFQDKSQSH
nr:MAG TPA: Putative zinc ribbon domain [Crassvirales sp.]